MITKGLIIIVIFSTLAGLLISYPFVKTANNPVPNYCVTNEMGQKCQSYYSKEQSVQSDLVIKLTAFSSLVLALVLYRLKFSLLKIAVIIVCSTVVAFWLYIGFAMMGIITSTAYAYISLPISAALAYGFFYQVLRAKRT